MSIRSSRLSASASKEDLIDVLRKIQEQEEDELVVYAIREELMDRVMEGIQEKYLEKQTIKYVVDCAFEALVKFLNIYFYPHQKVQPYYEGHPAWQADEPVPPSPPDTWAVSSVPAKKNVEIETVQLVSEEVPEGTVHSLVNSVSGSTDTGYSKKSKLIDVAYDYKSSIGTETNSSVPSSVGASRSESVKDMEGSFDVEELTEEEEEEAKEEEKPGTPVSSFTTFAIRGEVKDCQVASRRSSRIRLPPIIHKQSLPGTKPPEIVPGLPAQEPMPETLPPIRVATTYDSRPGSKTEEDAAGAGTKKKKSKSDLAESQIELI